MKYLFLITSTIHVGNARTIFSPEQRLEQTINTINTIKCKINDPLIYLFESSELDNNEKTKILEQGVNLVVLNNIDFINDRTKNINQSIGEIAIMKYSLDYLFENNILDDIDYLFKISGRYYLNDVFDLTKICDSNKYTFRLFQNNSNKWLSTVLYCVPSIKFKEFTDTVNNGLDKISVNIETYYGKHLHDIKEAEYIGVSGRISHSGEYIEH